MNKVSLIIFLSLVFLLVSCSSPASPTMPFNSTSNPISMPGSATTESESSIVIITSKDPDYPLLAIYPGGEILIIKALRSPLQDEETIEKAILMLPDHNSLVIYFANGLPMRTYTGNSWIELSDMQKDTTTITIHSQNEINSTLYNVPFEHSEIQSMGHQGPIEVELIKFTSSAVRSFSCAISVAVDDDLAGMFNAGCDLPADAGAVMASKEESLINCGSGNAKENLKSVSECIKGIVGFARSVESAIPEFISIGTPIANNNITPIQLPRGVPITYEGESVSCTCDKCSCDTNPFFRVTLTIDQDGNILGVFEKYTELFPEMQLMGKEDGITGSVKSDGRLAYLTFEGSLGRDGDVLTATLTAVFEDSGAAGIRELVLYKKDQ